MPQVATIARALNEYCVARGPAGKKVKWPQDNLVYRGTALPKAVQPFFSAGKK